MTEALKKQLIHHEGLRLHPYRCTAGKLTIGVGRNIEDNGITRDEAMYMLENDIQQCFADLAELFPDFQKFSSARQYALVDLRFNLGPNRFRSFRRMIAAIREQDWEEAAIELKDSLWWNQVQMDRKDTLHHQLRTGEM